MKTIYERFLKRALFFILIILFYFSGNAAVYYVSSTAGNDSNTGFSSALAWKSLAKVNSATFMSGDQILFQKGDTFYGSLIIKNSGSATSQITFGTYGTGANPIISGFTNVTSWIDLGSNIWESSSAISTLSTLNIVAVGTTNTFMGHEPNTGMYVVTSGALSKSQLTSTSLTGAPWTGAEVVVRSSGWTYERRPITSQTTNTITWSTLLNQYMAANEPFFIQNDIRTCDQQGEWFYDTSTKKLKMYSVGQPLGVKASSIDNLITLTGSNITIDGIDFEGSNAYSIYNSTISTTNHKIKNCNFRFSGGNAVNIKGSHVVVDNCTFTDTNGIAIYCLHDGYDMTVNNCTFTRTAMNGGIGFTLGAFTAAINIVDCNLISITNNKLYYSGQSAINPSRSDSVLVKNNVIDTFAFLLDDAGAIHVGDIVDTPSHTGCKIEGNIILNGIGVEYTSLKQAVGIYLDSNSQDWEVFNNTVSKVAMYGFLGNGLKYNYIHDNTFFDCGRATICLQDINGKIWTDNTVVRNIFVIKNSTTWVSMYRYQEDVIRSSNNIFDYNYYCKPMNDADNMFAVTYATLPSSYKTFSEWKPASNQDSHSLQSPVSITSENDLRFEYNASTSLKTLTLSEPMVDVKGTKYSTSVTLQPFTSVVLMIDPNPASSVKLTEYKSICEGANYNGWTISGTYERTLTAKSGGDSIITTNLTVNPKYSISENVTIAEGETYKEWTISGQYSRTFTSLSGCDSTIVTNLTVEKNVTKQAEILPTHFIPVWQGENGLNHMNIMVVSAVLEDLPLNANDEIAVFDGAICVGSMKLSVPINSADNTTFLTIPASQNDGTNNGFNEQDSIIFKIWDDQNQTEMLVKTINYRHDIGSWNTSGKYAAGATSVVELVSFIEFSQSIELVKGYNLISTNVAPLNSDASIITQALCEAGSLVKIQDESGKSLEDWGSYGGWINQLGTIQNTEGYKIKVANNCILQVTGRPIALPLDIPLKTGWNIISFPRTDQIDALSVVQSLIDQNVLVKVQDELGNSVENWGIFGGWKNSIGFFMPGKAYKVKLSADAILTIQDNYIKSALILAKTEKTEYFISDIVGNGTDHMNINVIGLSESGISAGDELAAFDGNNCVGTLKITENNLIDGSAALVTSFSSDEQNPDGFIEGHPIRLIHWNKQAGIETQVDLDVLNGQALYAKNSSVLIRLKSITTEVSIFDDRMKIDVFPNPCSGRFTVRFSNLPVAGSKLDILDISGRKILSRMITGMSEDFNLDHQSSGIYLVKSVINSKETIQKLIIN